MPLETLKEHLLTLRSIGVEHLSLTPDQGKRLRALLEADAARKSPLPHNPAASIDADMKQSKAHANLQINKPQRGGMEIARGFNPGYAVSRAAPSTPSGERESALAASEGVQEPIQEFNPMPRKTKIVINDLPALPLPAGDKRTQWEWLRNRVLTDPEVLSHVRAGVQPVFGVGNIDSPIFFCGEAPGAEEEQQGEPFVGRAGQLLTKIINALGFERKDVYIANILNWRPEKDDMTAGNRPPSLDEMAKCLPFLKAQVNVVRPKVIVALGATAVTGLLGEDPDRRMGACRGNFFDFAGTPVMVTYHPSYLLRNNTNAAKRIVWEDLLCVMRKVGLPISPAQEKYFL